MTILLVQDPALAGSIPAELLKATGLGLRFAPDADQALDLFLKKPDRVVLCLLGHWESALGLCRKIRKASPPHYPYFILVAPQPDSVQRHEALRQGVDAWIGPDLELLAAQIQVGLRISGFRAPDPETRGRLNLQDFCQVDIVFAKTALGRQTLTKKELARAFSLQQREKKAGAPLALAETLIKYQILTPEQVAEIDQAARQLKTRKFGALAVKEGLVTQEQVDQALAEQARAFKEDQVYKKTGDILVSQGVISPQERDRVRQTFVAPDLWTEPGSGPQDLDQVDLVEIQISADQMAARLFLKPQALGRISDQTLLDALAQKQIQVKDPQEISGFLARAAKGENGFLVAQGRPPTPGEDATIVYHFDTDHLTAGTIDSTGTMDYRKRGTRPRVAAGDLLVTKTPPKEGSPGVTVSGHLIPVPPPQDLPLKPGDGVTLSSDGLSLYAAIDGQPNLAFGGTVSVFSELTIDGDLDFRTGNIEFDGNVTVKGAIKDGFTVKCGDLSAKEILGAVIVAMGDVTVAGGIVGASIQTEGSLTALYISDANIKAFGSVTVEKQVMDTKIRSSGKFTAPRGKVISSFISAKMGCEAREIGTEKSSPCRINVGQDENVKKRIQAYNFTIQDKKRILEKAQAQYEAASRKQQETHARIAELAQNQERLMAAARSLEPQHHDLADPAKKAEATLRLETIQKKMLAFETETSKQFDAQEKLEERIAEHLALIEASILEIEALGQEKTAVLKWSESEQGEPVVRVHGTITANTLLFGSFSNLTVKEPLRNVTIREIRQPDSELWQMTVLN